MSTSLIHKSAIVCSKAGGGLQLSIEREYGCGHCASSPGCGLSALPKPGAAHVQLSVPDQAVGEVGQTIRLTIPAAGLGRLAIIYYLTIPILMFIGAVCLSSLYDSGGDLAAILGCTLGFFMGCAALKLYDARAGRYWLDRLQMQQVPERLTGR